MKTPQMTPAAAPLSSMNGALVSPRVEAGSHPLRVLLFDLLPTVPYYTGHLAAALQRLDGVDVLLGSATYAYDRKFYERMGLKHSPGIADVAYRAPSGSVRRALKLGEYLINLMSLVARFLWRKPDVIHVQFTPLAEHQLPFELWFLKMARGLGIKIVYTVHNVLPHEGGERLRSDYARLYCLVDHFICHDHLTKERLVDEFGLSATRMSVIPHGPLFAEQLPGLEHGKPSKNTPCIVLWQGIIRPYKGIPLLLDAWKAAQDAGMDAALQIVGTGEPEMLANIREQVRSLGIESSVRLDFRFVSVEELAAYYKSADVVAYPYSAVTTSGALMTGIGYGKAIIASDLPAFRQILVDRKNALLVSAEDLSGWAQALLQITSNETMRTNLAHQLAVDHSALPDWNDIASETLLAYGRV